MTRLLLTWIVLLATPATPLAAAAAIEPSAEFLETLDAFSRKLVRIGDAAAAERLQLEADYDPRIAEYLRIHGDPELMFVVDRWRVRLFYLRFDTMVSFVREGADREALVKPVVPIPERFEKRLRLSELSIMLAVRAAQRVVPPSTRSAGSCFAVSPDGLILTAEHTVHDASEIVVRWTDGSEASAKVERIHPEHDLALLRVVATDRPYLSLTAADTIPLGRRVFSVGFPAPRVLGSEPKFSEGAIAGRTRGPKGARLLLMSVPTQPGSSGAPLLDESGAVVGVVVGVASHGAFMKWTGQRPQNVNFAIPASSARDWITSPAQPAAADRRAAITRAVAAVCLVEVTKPPAVDEPGNTLSRMR
jgi:S1-C subfamily serine protease